MVIPFSIARPIAEPVALPASGQLSIVPTINMNFLSVLPANAALTRATNGADYSNAGALTTYSTDVARFGFNPNTLTPNGLLIEVNRTNNLLQSEDFATGWTLTGSTVATNTTNSPAGTLTADTLTENTSTGAHSILRDAGVAANTVQCVSWFIRANGRTRVQLTQRNATTPADLNQAQFTLSGAGSVVSGPTNGGTGTGATAGIEQLPNSYYRIWVGGTPSSGVGNTEVLLELHDGISTSYTGNGTSGVIIWGSQHEITNARPTSYIATTTAAATRALDNCTITSFPSFRGDIGTIYTEALVPLRDLNNSQFFYQLDDGTTNNSLRVYFISTNGTVRVEHRSAATLANIALAGVPTTGAICRVAMAYTANNISASRDGGTVGTTSLVAGAPVGINTFRLGRASTTSQFLNGHLRRFVYWPYAMSDLQLQQLSTTGI